MIQQSRRGFLSGIGAIIAAPAIVRASSLMPVKSMGPWSGGDAMLPWTQVTPEQMLADMEAMVDRLLNQASEQIYLPWSLRGDGGPPLGPLYHRIAPEIPLVRR